MTEQKAIDNLVSMKVEIEYETDDTKQMKRIKCETIKVAITALEEIQQYRALGTVRQIKDFISDWRKFRELGNLEELREAMEKQMAKKPRVHESDYSYFVCDKCGEGIYYSDDFESHHYCLNCGQAIDWSKEE